MTDTIRLLLDEPDPTVFIIKLAGLAILAAMLLAGVVMVLECVSLHRRITRRRETFSEWRTRHALIEEYCDALAKNGVDSPQTQAVRDSNAGNAEFLEFADSIDKVKRALR